MQETVHLSMSHLWGNSTSYSVFLDQETANKKDATDNIKKSKVHFKITITTNQIVNDR